VWPGVDPLVCVRSGNWKPAHHYCHFQSGQKFKMRYAMLGFRDKAALDEGALWPVADAVNELTPEAEARIAELVKKVAG